MTYPKIDPTIPDLNLRGLNDLTTRSESFVLDRKKSEVAEPDSIRTTFNYVMHNALNEIRLRRTGEDLEDGKTVDVRNFLINLEKQQVPGFSTEKSQEQRMKENLEGLKKVDSQIIDSCLKAVNSREIEHPATSPEHASVTAQYTVEESLSNAARDTNKAPSSAPTGTLRPLNVIQLGQNNNSRSQ